MVEEAVEGRLDLLEGGVVGLRDGPVVPLDAGAEGGVAQVRAADEGDAGAVRALEDVGLGVEGERGRLPRVPGAGGVRGFEDAELAVAFEVEEAGEGVGLGDAAPRLVSGGENDPLRALAAAPATFRGSFGPVLSGRWGTLLAEKVTERRCRVEAREAQ